MRSSPFSDAGNLAELTPPWLGFRYGLPVNWTTLIRRWEPPGRFTGAQWSRPYRLWHHTHRFEDHGARTRMPLGILGRTVRRLIAQRDLERVFDYRFRRLNQLFPA